MIQTISRYKVFTEVRNDELAVVSLPMPVTNGGYLTHITRENESFDLLATKYLGAPIFYWMIAKINPQVQFPDRIPPGTAIRIPR
jgi:nucleoid-associated protein YgaU